MFNRIRWLGSASLVFVTHTFVPTESWTYPRKLLQAPRAWQLGIQRYSSWSCSTLSRLPEDLRYRRKHWYCQLIRWKRGRWHHWWTLRCCRLARPRETRMFLESTLTGEKHDHAVNLGGRNLRANFSLDIPISGWGSILLAQHPREERSHWYCSGNTSSSFGWRIRRMWPREEFRWETKRHGEWLDLDDFQPSQVTMERTSRSTYFWDVSQKLTRSNRRRGRSCSGSNLSHWLSGLSFSISRPLTLIDSLELLSWANLILSPELELQRTDSLIASSFDGILVPDLVFLPLPTFRPLTPT